MSLAVANCPRCKQRVVFGERRCGACQQPFEYGDDAPPEPTALEIRDALKGGGKGAAGALLDAAGPAATSAAPRPGPPPAASALPTEEGDPLDDSGFDDAASAIDQLVESALMESEPSGEPVAEAMLSPAANKALNQSVDALFQMAFDGKEASARRKERSGAYAAPSAGTSPSGSSASGSLASGSSASGSSGSIPQAPRKSTATGAHPAMAAQATPASSPKTATGAQPAIKPTPSTSRTVTSAQHVIPPSTPSPSATSRTVTSAQHVIPPPTPTQAPNPRTVTSAQHVIPPSTATRAATGAQHVIPPQTQSPPSRTVTSAQHVIPQSTAERTHSAPQHTVPSSTAQRTSSAAQNIGPSAAPQRTATGASMAPTPASSAPRTSSTLVASLADGSGSGLAESSSSSSQRAATAIPMGPPPRPITVDDLPPLLEGEAEQGDEPLSTYRYKAVSTASFPIAELRDALVKQEAERQEALRQEELRKETERRDAALREERKRRASQEGPLVETTRVPSAPANVQRRTPTGTSASSVRSGEGSIPDEAAIMGESLEASAIMGEALEPSAIMGEALEPSAIMGTAILEAALPDFVDTGRFEATVDLGSAEIPGFVDSRLFGAYTPKNVVTQAVVGFDNGRADDVGAVVPTQMQDVETTSLPEGGEAVPDEMPGFVDSSLFARFTPREVSAAPVEGMETTALSSTGGGRTARVPTPRGGLGARPDLPCRNCGTLYDGSRCPSCGTPRDKK